MDGTRVSCVGLVSRGRALTSVSVASGRGRTPDFWRGLGGGLLESREGGGGTYRVTELAITPALCKARSVPWGGQGLNDLAPHGP